MTTTVKERGILFSAPMVRAIRDGRKTQTRRVADIRWDTSKYWGRFDCWTFYKGGRPFIGFGTGNRGQDTLVGHCPYGKPGDRLWVRETWRCFGGREYEYQQEQSAIRYRADSEVEPPGYGIGEEWRPSIFMPRWASRITLEITGIRVERLQDITEEDAKAEGCDPVVTEGGFVECGTRKTTFATLWDSINAKKHPWSSNSWVWVLSFRRL